MSIGERLRKLRKQQNLTREQLSIQTGITVAALGNYERDERKPNFEAMTKLEKYFGVSTRYLRGEVDENDSQSVKDELLETLSDLLSSSLSALDFLRNLPQEESLEAFTALDTVSLLISNPNIKQESYIFYIKTLTGIIAEIHRFTEVLGKANHDQNFNIDKVANLYSESIKRDLFDIAELYGFKRQSWQIYEGIAQELDRIYIPIMNIPLTQSPGRVNRSLNEEKKLVPLDVQGETAAGRPIEICDWRRGSIRVDEKHAKYNSFLIHVQGDSMTGAGIEDGDYVVIRPQPTVENGEIALIGIDSESTIKYFYKHNDGVELRSANPAYEPYFYNSSEEIRILGKVVDVIPKEKAVMEL
jgi:SOS-response transcriptional repressor LexA